MPSSKPCLKIKIYISLFLCSFWLIHSFFCMIDIEKRERERNMTQKVIYHSFMDDIYMYTGKKGR